jgi:GNAT superfamily N-acetyltransferase
MTEQGELIFETHDEWLPLERSTTPLVSALALDPVTVEACAQFDYTETQTAFYPWAIPSLPAEYSIGLIVGGSGTGKSVLLKQFGEIAEPVWNPEVPIAGHFPDYESALEAFYAVGLSAVPTWTKPYHILSNGEKFRADLARQVGDGQVVDEFTSVVDRTVAKAASRTLRKYVEDKAVKNLVIASCHRDIIEWLEPDWIIDTDAGMYCLYPKECLHREPLVADIYEVKHTMWSYFMEHHYLTRSLNRSATCYLAVIDGKPAGFSAALYFPSGSVRNAYRSSRIVVKPDYQGFGLGTRLSDWVGKRYVDAGYRFFGRTPHARLGEYREKSPLWKATSMNKRARRSNDSVRDNDIAHWTHDRRLGYSHEYIGANLKEGA